MLVTMETLLKAQEISLSAATMEEMEAAWQAVKRTEV